MIYIRAITANIIDLISWVAIPDSTCIVDSLPADFMFYLQYGKYEADANGIYIIPNWIDFTPEEIDIILNSGQEIELEL